MKATGTGRVNISEKGKSWEDSLIFWVHVIILSVGRKMNILVMCQTENECQKN